MPVLTNFCLEEYLNIGYMEGISDVFNSIRGFNMSVQLAVQSLSQWKEKYPGTEWENQLNAFDRTIYMGCNDLTSAKYFAEKCGKVTISVTNNQFPLMPLFSPVYSSKKEKRDTDLSHIEVSQSVSARSRDGRTDEEIEEELLDILDGCELYCFEPETALVFENAIERLFYADSFRIGNATLPQCRVRAKLKRLDGMILRDVESKLHANQDRAVKNSTAYTMAVLFNCIAENESDLMIDPYLNAICATA